MRLATGVAAVFIALDAPGCADRSGNVGAGEDIEFCAAYRGLDRFGEPKPDSKEEVLTYSSFFVRVIDRVDERRDLDVRKELETRDEKKRLKVTPEALADLKIVRDSMVRLRDAVKAAPSDGAPVRTPVNEQATEEAKLGAERRLAAYFASVCRADT